MRLQYICRDCGKPARPAVFYSLDEFVKIPVCIVCDAKRRESRKRKEKNNV